MIERDALLDLQQWLLSQRRKPLILRGARQVGKSTLVRELCRQAGLDLFEVNLERVTLSEIDKEKNYSLDRLIEEIELVLRKRLSPQTLLFFDEVQESPQLIAKLRYFFEEKPELPVIAAGSLIEFVLHNHQFSMPVGRVQYYYLGPLRFFEFLKASNRETLKDYLVDKFPRPISKTIHEKLTQAYKEFLFIGGMPEAVATYQNTRSLLEVSFVHREILTSYRDDFGKYNTSNTNLYLEKVFQFCTHHLGERFKYSQIHENKAHEIKKAINLLAQAKIVFKAKHSHCSGLPLELGAREDRFKLFFLDVGLAYHAQGGDWTGLDQLDPQKNLSKGGLAEQFVAQHLLAQANLQHGSELYYWFRDKRGSQAEVDFVIQHNQMIVPIEIKAGKTGTIRSLLQYAKEKSPDLCLRLDLAQRDRYIEPLKDFPNTQLINLPLYAVELLSRSHSFWKHA